MEYADQSLNLGAMQRVRSPGAVAAANVRTDLTSIRGDLENLIRRAGDVASSVHSLADTIVGPRPENVGSAAAPQSLQPAISELIEDLGRAISRAESGLNRF